MHSSRGSVGVKAVVAVLLAGIVVAGIVVVAVRASGNGSSSAASPPAGASPTPSSKGKNGHLRRNQSPSPAASLRSYNPSVPASQQPCDGRLGPSAGKLPKHLPPLPGTTYDGIDNRNGVYAGHVAGNETATPAAQLRTIFSNAGFQVTTVATQGTVSKFAFKRKNVAGLAYVAVLCQNTLRVEYQLALPPAPATPTAVPVPVPSTPPAQSHN